MLGLKEMKDSKDMVAIRSEELHFYEETCPTVGCQRMKRVCITRHKPAI